ncbi:hypothetical protein WN982_28445 [Paraburkholderia sp. IMGN_8]|uniref:hypothetical protein n=1 Tax=Paraburkholderia sp. IMGN_8 TaxID=3136564 RepID=UPI0031019474
MKFRHIATSALLAASFCTFAATDDTACATLVGTANSAPSQSFRLRDGEPVDLVSGTKTVHGKLLLFVDGGTYHAYWQPENSPEKYVLADAGLNSVRLISTPTQGAPAKSGEPRTTLAPQRVLSCPTL